MSEEHGVDGNEKSSGSFNRRSFVKALGAAGGTATVGAASIGSAAAKKPTKEMKRESEKVLNPYKSIGRVNEDPVR